MKYNLIQGENLNNKAVVLRTDLNVPIKNGIVTDTTRIVESFPTIDYAIQNGAKQIFIIAHFGRPKGKTVEEMSLAQIIPSLEAIYGRKVELFHLNSNHKPTAKIVLVENIRFFEGEEKNSDELSQTLAKLGEIYINDAFSASHRSHASISGIAKYTKVCAGLLLQKEINTIEGILSGTNSEKICTIIGGSKVSTKFELLENLISKSKYIVLGGGMANTFLFAKSFGVGGSLFEEEFAPKCREILQKAEKIGTEIILPKAVIVAKEFKENTEIEVKNVKNINENDIILDVFLHEEVAKICQKVDFTLWNGPLGAFEIKPFLCGTETIARVIAKETSSGKIQSIIGGGDVVSAISTCGLKNSMTYISTGGGAFLEWLEGKVLPGIKVCLTQ